MRKIIGGILFGIFTILIMANIDLWENTATEELFTLLLAMVFVIGSFHIGEMIIQWFDENDTTS